MTAKKVIGKLHLWLGLASGLIVFIVALTGCLYAFQAEIQDATQPHRFVQAQNKPVLAPSKPTFTFRYLSKTNRLQPAWLLDSTFVFRN